MARVLIAGAAGGVGRFLRAGLPADPPSGLRAAGRLGGLRRGTGGGPRRPLDPADPEYRHPGGAWTAAPLP
ncbi:hypothetical protein ACFQZC_06670 [Streptacidiphilus monticola]